MREKFEPGDMGAPISPQISVSLVYLQYYYCPMMMDPLMGKTLRFKFRRPSGILSTACLKRRVGFLLEEDLYSLLYHLREKES